MRRLLKSHRYYYKEVLALLFLLLALYFFRHERSEIKKVGNVLSTGNINWIAAGIVVTAAFVFLNALMYTSSFRVVHKKIGIFTAADLFLKRNLVSVFLPGGGITSLAFFTREIERQGVSKTKINFASYIYAVIGIASLVIIAIPVLSYLGLHHSGSENAWLALSGLIILIGLLAGLTYSFVAKGWVYRKLIRLSPQIELIRSEVGIGRFSKFYLLRALFFSMLIEIAGITHLYISMRALGFSPNLEACAAGYITATLFLVVSPFLRGLGAIEVSLTYILTSYGFYPAEALSITLLYRLFEFWLPLLAGALTFLLNKGNIVLRIMPGVLIFLLGVINIVSVLTPAIAARLRLVHNFVPVNTTSVSNYLVMLMGIMLIITAAFLIRGLRNAWYLALFLSAFSLIGHLVKAIDYEEAALALFVVLALLITRKQYYIKGNKSLQSFGIGTAAWTLAAILIYGIVGFYFLDKKDFGVDFSLKDSIVNTLKSFLLINPDIEPLTHFAKAFVYSINIFGVASILLLFYAFIKPYVLSKSIEKDEFKLATALLNKYGRSSLDYFKVYPDKHLFFNQQGDAFVAYKFARGYAIALEGPVCNNNKRSLINIISQFEQFCLQNGLKPAWYRVSEEYLEIFHKMNKKSLLIGQEAIVNIHDFSLEGKERKSMRNALHGIEKRGYKTHIYSPPLKDGLIQKLKLVSDDWLNAFNRQELVFSQGMFIWQEIKYQTVITLENEDEKVVAFLNLIPDYVKNEASYDMIRKTSDAPPGNMDALIIALIDYCIEEGYGYLNMGLAPLSGIERGKDLPERTIKFAYEKLQQFRHFKGLRDFKDKFNPVWHNKYLVYQNHYDLLQLPLSINRVMKLL